MDFKTMAISATLGGTILLSGLTFTGVIDLQEIRGYGQDWAQKLSQAVDNSKQMASKFNLFKEDTQSLINEKIAKINELQARINELGEEVANGSLNLEDANNEIARLNEQLEQANNEVKALKDEFAMKDSEVQEAFNQMVTADSLDTNLTLDNETTAPTTPEETPEEEAPTQAPNHEATETAIYNALTTQFSNLEDLQVTVTDNQIVISEPQLLATEGTYRNVINSTTGLVLAMGQKNGSTITYNY